MIAYFDCFSGISGDMILGAFVDLGVDISILRKELGKLAIKDVGLEAKRIKKNGIMATKISVITNEESAHRHLNDINKIIEASSLSDYVKKTSSAIFHKLAVAEAEVHGTVPEKIHFHEVGAVDAIIDVVGSTICFEYLRISKFYCSAVNLGTGLVECQHGVMPVPAPAVCELLRNGLVYSDGTPSELATPTGAAIVGTVAASFGPLPKMVMQKIGYGAGNKDFKQPNLLRVMLGTEEERMKGLG